MHHLKKYTSRTIDTKKIEPVMSSIKSILMVLQKNFNDLKFSQTFLLLFIFEGFSLVTDKGFCISKEGKWFSGCVGHQFESHEECGWSCINLGSCVAFNYNKQTQRCYLITTSKPENDCPNVLTWKERNVFAKSVDDLKALEMDANSVCYARIKVDKKELR